MSQELHRLLLINFRIVRLRRSNDALSHRTTSDFAVTLFSRILRQILAGLRIITATNAADIQIGLKSSEACPPEVHRAAGLFNRRPK